MFYLPPDQLIKPVSLKRTRTVAVCIDSGIISQRRGIPLHLDANRPHLER